MTKVERYEALAVRCEQASGPDAKLEMAIADVIMAPLGWGMSACRYTASIDAAMTLVPAGRKVMLAEELADTRWRATLSYRDDGQTWCHPFRLAATPALALCAASLRALSQETPDEQD